MSNNVFIIGNGFDLDLGLPTKYSDFAKSSFWPKASPRTGSNASTGNIRLASSTNPILLEHYLEKKRNLNTWFDLENELLLYSQVENKSNGKESSIFIEKNIAYYTNLQNSLCEYIISIEGNDTNKESTAFKVLKSIINNEYFEQIYSFNYTDLNKIAQSLGLYNHINYIHIHGKVEDGSIITSWI